MQDTPDARTLRRRRTGLLVLCCALVLLSARSSLTDAVTDLFDGLHDGFFDDGAES